MPNRTEPFVVRWSSTCPTCQRGIVKRVHRVIGVAKPGVKKPWVYAYFHEGCEPSGTGHLGAPGGEDHPEDDDGFPVRVEMDREGDDGAPKAPQEPRRGYVRVGDGAPAPGSLEGMIADIAARIAEERVAALAARIKVDAPRGGIVVQVDDVEIAHLEDETPHACLPRVMDLVRARRNVALVGPAGCGKSRLAATVAKVLRLDFAGISCSAGMSEGQLCGRLLPVGEHGQWEYVRAEFVRIYEQGGVFLLDEMDAADPNTLLCINAALANGHLFLANRPSNPIAVRHADAIILAALNTFGTGADRMYVGRAQLDESTLDRFRIGTVEMDYSPEVEERVCPDDALRGRIQAIRAKARAGKLRRVISTRFMEDAYIMVSGCGWTLETCIAQLVAGWTPEEKRIVGVAA